MELPNNLAPLIEGLAKLPQQKIAKVISICLLGYIAYLAAPLGLMIFNLLGFYYLQNFVYKGGFFISVELIPVITTMIWATFFFNQIFARIILTILDKIIPQ